MHWRPIYYCAHCSINIHIAYTTIDRAFTRLNIDRDPMEKKLNKLKTEDKRLNILFLITSVASEDGALSSCPNMSQILTSLNHPHPHLLEITITRMWLYIFLTHCMHGSCPLPNITTYFNHQLQMDVQQLATMYEHVNACSYRLCNSESAIF